jgi:hypothetical protein
MHPHLLQYSHKSVWERTCMFCLEQRWFEMTSLNTVFQLFSKGEEFQSIVFGQQGDIFDDVTPFQCWLFSMVLYLYSCIMYSQQYYIGKCIPTWLAQSTEIMSYEQTPKRACSIVTTGKNATAMQLFSDGQQNGHACQHSQAPQGTY